jgi:hypothetical protein
MHFQVFKDNYYNGLLKRIGECFPEFHSVFDKEDGIYPILGEIGIYIGENFGNKKIRSSAVEFINEAIEQGGAETEDAVVLQLFQKWYDNIILSMELKKLLNPKALSIFEKYLEEYNKKRY